MGVAKSRITGQGQISVPAEVRKRLGVGPGSILEWEFADGHVTVRRAGKYSSVYIHEVLFPTPPQHRTVEEIDEGIARHLRKKHARR
jgi:AbrB family looped-hinge helix DNA binding protein